MKRLMLTISWTMLCCLGITFIPLNSYGILAPADDLFIPGESEKTRGEDLRTVRKVLEHKIVQQRLEDIGLTQDEINARLDRLPDSQLHLMAMQVNALIPAGDDGVIWTIVGILLIILLVVLLVALL